jgi:hypothetical protein
MSKGDYSDVLFYKVDVDENEVILVIVTKSETLAAEIWRT